MYKRLETLIENIQIWFHYRTVERQQAAHDAFADTMTTAKVLGSTYRMTNHDFFNLAMFTRSDVQLTDIVNRGVESGTFYPTTHEPAHDIDAHRSYWNEPTELRVNGETYTTTRAISLHVQELIGKEQNDPGRAEDPTFLHARDVFQRGLTDGSIIPVITKRIGANESIVPVSDVRHQTQQSARRVERSYTTGMGHGM